MVQININDSVKTKKEFPLPEEWDSCSAYLCEDNSEKRVVFKLNNELGFMNICLNWTSIPYKEFFSKIYYYWENQEF